MVSAGGPDPPSPYQEGNDIVDWIDMLNDYMLASHGAMEDDRKLAMLRSCIGVSHITTVKHLQSQMTEENRKKYADVCKAVLEKFSIRRSVIVERHCFNIMIQDVDENITSFTKRLREQAVKCKFTATVATQSVDLTDEFVRDRIVVGLRDNTARSRLLREKDLTLVSALELVTNIEIADEHVKRLTNEVHSGYYTQASPAG